jgi:hypothetical protein
VNRKVKFFCYSLVLVFFCQNLIGLFWWWIGIFFAKWLLALRNKAQFCWIRCPCDWLRKDIATN